jgi:DNA-binding beta-propeller fold protein YncE
VLVARAVGKSGKVLFRVGADDPDTAPGRPTALAYGAGTLYVADAASGTIKCYDRRGRFVREIEGASQAPLGYIGGMAYTDGSLIVTESDSGRVTRIDAATGAVAGFAGDARALPRGVVAMREGAVAVSDVLGGAVTVCDSEGRVVLTVDRTTVAQAALRSPEGVAWRQQTRRLYVTDPDLGKVVVINVRE